MRYALLIKKLAEWITESTAIRQLSVAITLSVITLATAAKEPTLVKHYDRGYSPLLRVYLTDVLRTALDKTIPEHGPYELVFYSQNLSSNRSKLETERGEDLDVLFSTHWQGLFVDPENVIRLEQPIFNGMLGLRSLIVTHQQYDRFSQLRTREQLLQFTAGQGSRWADIDVLKANQIDVVEAQLFDGLFPMLARHRYDYLPLSVLEAQTALQTKGLQYENLVIHEGVCLYYPMPVHLFVNAQKQELARRLTQGLRIAADDGSMARLFRQHFYYLQPILTGPPKKIVVLRNPFMTEEHNEAAVKGFLAQYERIFEVLP